MQDTEGSDECDQCNPGRYRSGTGGNSGNAAGGGEYSCANDGGHTGYRFLDPDQQTNYPGGLTRTTAGDGSGGGACAANCASQDSCIAFMVHANSYCYIYTSDETFASAWNVNADTITYTACEEEEDGADADGCLTFPDFSGSTGTSASLLDTDVYLGADDFTFSATVTFGDAVASGNLLTRHRSGYGGPGFLSFNAGNGNPWRVFATDMGAGASYNAGASYSVILTRSGDTGTFTVDGGLVGTVDCSAVNDNEAGAPDRDDSDGGGKVPLMVGH